MARRIETLLLDDLDGNEDRVETITFGWSDRVFQIDLGRSNRIALENALAPYVESARPVGPLRGAPAPRRSRSKIADYRVAAEAEEMGDDRAAVREWARSQGETIGERGRIPKRILEAYRAAKAPASS